MQYLLHNTQQNVRKTLRKIHMCIGQLKTYFCFTTLAILPATFQSNDWQSILWPCSFESISPPPPKKKKKTQLTPFLVYYLRSTALWVNFKMASLTDRCKIKKLIYAWESPAKNTIHYLVVNNFRIKNSYIDHCY